MVASLGLMIPREGLCFVLLTTALTMSSSFFLALSATQLRHQPRGPCYPAPELRPLAIGIADLQPFFAGAARPSSPLRTPGTDWHPKQSAGGMQFLCVAHTLVIIAPETGYRLTVLPRFRRRHFIWEMGDGRSRLRLTRCTCASAWVLLWACLGFRNREAATLHPPPFASEPRALAPADV